MNLIKYSHFLKRLGKVYAVWPLEPSVSKIWKTAYKYLWWFYLINHIIALLLIFNSCYKARNNVELFTFSWMEIIAFTEIIIILINYDRYQNTIKDLLNETEEYIVTVERDKQTYLKKRASIFAIIMVFILQLYGIIIILHISHPAETTWDSIFTTAYYPSSIRSPVVDVFLYIHEIVVVLHSSLMVVFDVIVVTMAYGCMVRFKLLADRFREANRYADLVDCIREHQDSLTMAKRTNKAVRFVALKTILCFIGYAVGAGLQIVNPKATTISLERFGVVLLTHSMRLILIASSADDLTTSSEEIGSSVYSTFWYENDRKSAKAKKLIILRCQNVAKISVAGFMPILCLSFITGIISTAISYFTTLRAITRS